MEKEVPVKYCLYARKSSESDERQAMSIDSQVKEMKELARREGLNVVAERFESKSAKESGQRKTFNKLLTELEVGKYNAILTWAPDRLSRNAGDLGSLVDLMDKEKLVAIRTFSQTFGNNPNEKFLLMILCSQAKLENDNRGINVKRGIRAKCEAGWRPGVAPMGYMNRSFNGNKDIILDPDRAPRITEMFNRAAQGWSGRRLKDWLDKSGFTSKGGGKVHLSQIFNILNNTFYYGDFEYPEGSGKIYHGSHEAITTRAVFEQIQKGRSVPIRAAWGSKNFAFKDIFKCGSCGASITAEEKFKKRKDGGFNRHVYYHCTKKVDPNCPEKYINEKDLVSQLIHFIAEKSGKIEITDVLATKALEHLEIVEAALGIRGQELGDIDPLTEYARFILMKGSYSQQANLVRGINGKFVIRNKTIEFE